MASGIIELSANPYESKIVFSSNFRELEENTIDKLCDLIKYFERFINQTETMLIVPDKYLKGTPKKFEDFCDRFFATDSESKKYCKEKKYPLLRT